MSSNPRISEHRSIAASRAALATPRPPWYRMLDDCSVELLEALCVLPAGLAAWTEWRAHHDRPSSRNVNH
jgi:hypothetical protein